jgi:hypothetical protein
MLFWVIEIPQSNLKVIAKLVFVLLQFPHLP